MVITFKLFGHEYTYVSETENLDQAKQEMTNSIIKNIEIIKIEGVSSNIGIYNQLKEIVNGQTTETATHEEGRPSRD